MSGAALQNTIAAGHMLLIFKEIFAQLRTPTTFSTQNLFELFSFIQPTFSGEDALLAERHQTLRSPAINDSITTVVMRSINEGIARYTSRTRLAQEYLKAEGALVWDAKKNALLDRWLG